MPVFGLLERVVGTGHQHAQWARLFAGSCFSLTHGGILDGDWTSWPKVCGQLDYVVAKLKEDKDTRQAGLTIWRENPTATKDVPCTVAVFFSLRGMVLNAHVFMRSSDVWLGVPYDVFNFSMLSHLVCGLLNDERSTDNVYSPGKLYLTAASSHLYETNWADAKQCFNSEVLKQPDTPKLMWNDHQGLMAWLKDLRETKPGHGLRWWEQA